MRPHDREQFIRDLRRCLSEDQLIVSDLARWLDRPVATVFTWIYKGRLPSGPGFEDAHRRLAVLNRLIKERKPKSIISPIASPSERIRIMSELKHAHLYRGVSAPHPAD
jgi:hypothetical protein